MAAPRTLVFLALIAVSSCQTSDCSYNNLLDHLNLTTTSTVLEIMRPVKNWTSTTRVELKLKVYAILDVNEKFQTVTCDIWINMFWKNEFLTWNSSEFCGIDMLTLPKSMLWIPDIYIQEDTSDTGTVHDDPLVALYPDGLVEGNTREQLTFTCLLNLFRFPFDEQRCNITFSSMSSGEKYIKLARLKNDTAVLKLFDQMKTSEGEWKLEQMDIFESSSEDNNSPHSKLVYMVTLQRKPFLYVINLIMPLLFLLVLDLASFFIGEGTGEKLVFKVTILLSIFVLLLILKDILPSTEDNLPMIAIYCVTVFTLVWISVLETMLVSFLMSLDSYSGDAQSSFDFRVNIQVAADGPKEPAGAEEEDQPVKSCPPLDQPAERELLKLILDKVKSAQLETERWNKDEKKSGCCIKVAKVMDNVFFVLYFITVVLSQGCIFYKWNKLQY